MNQAGYRLRGAEVLEADLVLLAKSREQDHFGLDAEALSACYNIIRIWEIGVLGGSAAEALSSAGRRGELGTVSKSARCPFRGKDSRSWVGRRRRLCGRYD